MCGWLFFVRVVDIMRKRLKITVNQAEYKKELTRIKRFVKRAEKRGYKFNEGILPEMPKRVTKKALEKIKSIRPEDLYKNSTYYDSVSHETFTGVQGRRIERHRASLKRVETLRKKSADVKIRHKRRGKIKSSDSTKSAKKTKSSDNKTKTAKKTKSNGNKAKSAKKTKSNANKAKSTNTPTTPPNDLVYDDSVHEKNVQSGEYYPTVNLVDAVGEKLTYLDYVMNKLNEADLDDDWRYLWKRNAKSGDYTPDFFYSSIWLQTIQKYESAGAISELEKYAQENALEITNCIDVVYWASKKEEEGNWLRLSSRLVILLKGGEIPTQQEAQTLGELQEKNDLVLDDLVHDYED